MHPQRLRRRHRWLAAPLSLAMLSPGTHAAVFVPGADADPPTGDVGAAPAQAREPLRGSGIRWTLAPWRLAGSLAVDLRALRLEDGSSTRQQLLLGDVDLASYIWQPWFVQVRLGMGFVASHGSGDGAASGSQSNALTGRAAVSVFPASRFPFEARVDFSDSRSAGTGLTTDYRSRRVSLSQGYRPEKGNDSYHLQVEHSRLDDGRSVDTLSTLNATGVQQRGAHQFDYTLGHSDNQRSDTGEHTRLSSASAHHGWQPSAAVNVETLANWNELRLRASDLDIGSDVRQISTFASWRLPSAGRAPDTNAPLLAASARWVDARTLGREAQARTQAVNATLGVSHEWTQAWRSSVSASANQLHTGDAPTRTSTGAQATASWTPLGSRWGPWRYTPGLGFNAALTRDDQLGQRKLAGAQASHSLSREVALGEGSVLALNFSQSGAVLRESGAENTARALAHGAALSWQSVDAAGSQSFGGLSFSDSRTEGSTQGHFQLVNLQISQRTQLSRYANWAANLTLQATHNQASEVDVFTGQLRDINPGWQRFYNGTLSYETQRAFGVPRLRGTVLLGVNSQPLERRALGDIDAPRERITESLEARLDHSIGRLETRLSARAARVEGRTVVALQARAQRRF